jgi:hypothetical protein
VRLAGLHDPIPQVAAARRVAQVDLVADLAGPAGPADDDRDAVDLGRQRPVVLDVVDGGPKTVRMTSSTWAPGPGRVDLRLADLDVQPAVDRDAARPQAGVRVGQGHPPAVASMRSRTGSLTMPPSSAVTSMYLPWPTAHFVRSRTGQRVGERRGVRPG